ncbi:MAG: glycosyltransferase [Candidatus Aenigmarchaeota archaeon]|nr:glycosyltransferase [Candidatus Aenigmarchaeota archaeon]
MKLVYESFGSWKFQDNSRAHLILRNMKKFDDITVIDGPADITKPTKKFVKYIIEDSLPYKFLLKSYTESNGIKVKNRPLIFQKHGLPWTAINSFVTKKRVLRENPDVYVINHPLNNSWLLNTKTDFTTVFDVRDWIPGYYYRTERDKVSKLFIKMLKSVDKVITVSKPLVEWIEKESGVTANLIHTPVNLDNFKNARPLVKSSRPIVGAIGCTYKEWFRVDILDEITNLMKDFTFLYVGPSDYNFKPRDNVIMTGRVPFKDVKNYIASMDICLMPFKTYDFYTSCACPVKFFEYAALGKPMVSTNLPGILDVTKEVFIANTSEEFVTAIRKAVKRGTKPYPWIKNYDCKVIVKKYEDFLLN